MVKRAYRGYRAHTANRAYRAYGVWRVQVLGFRFKFADIGLIGFRALRVFWVLGLESLGPGV